VAPLVQGVSGCVHESFRLESEALDCFELARASGQLQCLGGAPRLAVLGPQHQQQPQQHQYQQPLARSSTEIMDTLMESCSCSSSSGPTTLLRAQSEQIARQRLDDTNGATVYHHHHQSESRSRTQVNDPWTAVVQRRTHSGSRQATTSSPPTDVTYYVNSEGNMTRHRSPNASNPLSSSSRRRLLDLPRVAAATPPQQGPSRQQPLPRSTSAYVDEPTESPTRSSGSGRMPLARTQSDRTVVPRQSGGSTYASGHHQREPRSPLQVDDPSSALAQRRTHSRSTSISRRMLPSPRTEVTMYIDSEGHMTHSPRGSISSTSSSRASRPLLRLDMHLSVHTPTEADSYPDHWTSTDVSDDSDEEPSLSPLNSPMLTHLSPPPAATSPITYRSPRRENTSRSTHSVSPRTIPSSSSSSSSSSSPRRRTQRSPNDTEGLPLTFVNRAGALHTSHPLADPRSPISMGTQIPLE
jgi:hypothetical protein